MFVHGGGAAAPTGAPTSVRKHLNPRSMKTQPLLRFAHSKNSEILLDAALKYVF